jgi:hypothetical protein
MHTSPRCQAPVDYFVVNEDGSSWGMLTSGVTFTQSNVINDYTRLQVFRAEEMFWYVSDKGVIYVDDDMTALSVYLSLCQVASVSDVKIIINV